MSFITQGRTNVKYILIVAILTFLVGVAILFYWWQIKIVATNMLEVAISKKTEEPLVPINTTDWKNYKNENYGFEFSYPKEWYVKEETGRFFLFDSAVCKGSCPQKNSEISFGVKNNDKLLSVADWIKQNVGTVGIETDEPFSIGDFQGIKRFYRGTGSTSAAILVVFARKDKLNTLYYFETAGYENRRILDQILLNFRFLE